MVVSPRSILIEIAAMKKLGSIFVRGLVNLVSGEKDPRNLMMVFSNLKVVIIEFDIVQHAEVYCP